MKKPLHPPSTPPPQPTHPPPNSKETNPGTLSACWAFPLAA